MDKLTFATTNEGKLKEAEVILGISVEGAGLQIDEVQSLDPNEVAIKKSLSYFEKLNKPVLIEDTSLEIKALGGLPGTLIDSFMKSIDNKGIVDLLSSKRDRTAKAIVTFVYIENRDNYNVFSGELSGKIAKFPRGEKGFGWDPIFIPDGDNRTLAEMEPEEKNAISPRRKALEKFKKWVTENSK